MTVRKEGKKEKNKQQQNFSTKSRIRFDFYEFNLKVILSKLSNRKLGDSIFLSIFFSSWMTLRVHRNDDGKSLKGRVVLTYSTLLVTILDALHQRIMMSLVPWDNVTLPMNGSPCGIFCTRVRLRYAPLNAINTILLYTRYTRHLKEKKKKEKTDRQIGFV